MQFDSLDAFLDMGGYGFYVWLSFGVSAFLLVLLVIVSQQQHKKVIQHIHSRQRREQKLRQAAELQKAKAAAPTDEAKEVSS